MGIHHGALGRLGHMSIFRKCSDIDLVSFEVTEKELYCTGGSVFIFLCKLQVELYQVQVK